MNKTIYKKPFWRKYMLAAVALLLLIFAALVISLFQQESKPDPASAKIIREKAAKQLGKEPNDLTDEDFARITELSLYGKELCDVKLPEKFTNLQYAARTAVNGLFR